MPLRLVMREWFRNFLFCGALLVLLVALPCTLVMGLSSDWWSHCSMAVLVGLVGAMVI
jgi:hypothetical protein